jgi:outer membrane receptor protein involved in Fe transport
MEVPTLKSWFLGALLLLMVAPLGAVELEVVDPTGTPLVGARVSVEGVAGSWTADGRGVVRIDTEMVAPVVVYIARSDGVLLSPVVLGELTTDGPIRVEVVAASDEVTVVSGVVPDLELPPAVAATVLARGDLAQREPKNLTEALENVPGVAATGEGRSAVPGLRGLPKHRTLILLDDGRVTTERRAGPSASFLDPVTLDEIEVVRGPGAVAYGSDAFGGVIRARSRMPSLDPGTSVRYSLDGAQGTPGWGAAADVEHHLGSGALLIGAHIRDYDDYDSPDGEVLDTRWSSWGARAAWRQEVAGGMLQVGWRTDRAEDVAKPAPDSDTDRQIYPTEESDRLNLSYTRALGGAWSRWAASLAWDRYRLVLERDSLDDDGTIQRRIRSDVSANDLGLRVEAERSLGSGRLVVGLDVSSRYGLEAINDVFEGDGGGLGEAERAVLVESASRTNAGLFAAVNGGSGPWSYGLGLRADQVRSENQGGTFGDQSVTNGAVSGFASISRRLGSGWEATAQVARGFRDALLSDRYYQGVTGRGFITGNPDLEPETSNQLDLALRRTGSGWSLGVYGYLYRIEDLIERFRDENRDFRFRNRGEAEITGFEVEAQVAVAPSMVLEGSAWWLEGEVRDDGAPTDDVPAPGVSVVLRSRPSQGLRWMGRVAAFLEDDRPGPSEQVVDSYTVVDGAVGWAFGPELEIQLLGRNLFDEGFLGSADEDAVLAPGRSFTLTLRGRL